MEIKPGTSGPEEQVEHEVQLNQLIAETRCSHILEYRGNSSRNMTRK
jgi:hypothetical protein